MTEFATAPWPTLELRPRRTAAIRWHELKNDSGRMLLMTIMFCYLAVKLAANGVSSDPSTVAVTAGTIAAIVGASLFVMGRMRLRVSADSIERVGGMRAKRAVRRDVIGVVRVPVESAGMKQGDVDLLVDRDGRCLLRFHCRLWKDGDLDRAWAHAGLGIQLASQSMSYRQLEAWIPGSSLAFERRPFLCSAWLTVGLIAVATVIVAITSP